MAAVDVSDTASYQSGPASSIRNARLPLSETFDLGGKITKLIVGTGPESISLQIHQDVLSRNSEFFKRAIKPEWAGFRDEPDSIDLSIHAPADVKAYAHWLYSSNIPTRDFDDTDGTRNDPIWIDLANAFVFGEKIMDRKYQRDIIETIAAVQSHAPDFPCAEAFAIVYDGTPEGSPARRLLADMYAHGAYDAPDWRKELELLPHEALLDVTRAMARAREIPMGLRPWIHSVDAYLEQDVSGFR